MAMDDNWEFYCDDSAGTAPSQWGWRLYENSVLMKSSARTFDTFTDCYVDAGKHGFNSRVSQGGDRMSLD